jgi:hypothetical protein
VRHYHRKIFARFAKAAHLLDVEEDAHASSPTKEPNMLFVVRGKSPDHHERTLRIEAESVHQAEAIGWARGIFVTEVMSKDEEIRRRAMRITNAITAIWRWITPRSSRVFGRQVSAAQSIAFLVSGMATWALDLRAFHFV